MYWLRVCAAVPKISRIETQFAESEDFAVKAVYWPRKILGEVSVSSQEIPRDTSAQRK